MNLSEGSLRPRTEKTRHTLWFVCAALGALLTSCNPAPKYVKPSAPAPVAYKETAPQEFKEGQGWKLAQPADDKIRQQWWELFNDPQLTILEVQVATGNQTLAASEANYRAAKALVVSARSQLFPLLTASPSYSASQASGTRTGQVINTGTGTTTSSKVFNYYALPIDVSYTVDFWHRIRNTIASNAFSAQASAADISTSRLSIQANLAQYYFELRAVDTQQAILEDSIANYKGTLDLTSILFRTGIDSEQDVVQARTQLDTAAAQLTDLGVVRAQYEHAIATLIGRPAATFSVSVAPFVPNPPGVPVALPSTLLERRPDIASQERLIAAANAQIGVARAAYYPNLTLSASGGFESTSFTQWFTWPSRFWSLGPVLSQTIFDGGARRAAVEQAQGSYDASVANYRQTVLTAFQAVEDNLAALRILAQEVGQQQTAITDSSRYLELALTRYKTGVDSYLNVITAQNSVLSNRESQVQTQLRQMSASVNLIVALGGGWDATTLPAMKDFIARPSKWSPGGVPLPSGVNGPVAPPNPPAVQPAPLHLPNGQTQNPTPSPGGRQ